MAVFPKDEGPVLKGAFTLEHNALPVLDDGAVLEIRAYLAAAVHVLSADGAAFVFTPGDGPSDVFTSGMAVDLRSSSTLSREALSHRLLLTERSANASAISIEIREAGLRFFASARVGPEKNPAGYLAVYSRDRRSLTGAQEYVLLMFAAEIGAACERREPLGAALEARATSAKPSALLPRLRSIVRDADDPVVIAETESLGSEPRVVFVNSAFSRSTGYEPHEVAHLTPPILGDCQPHAAARARLRTALTARRATEVELPYYRKDRTLSWMELSVVPVADDTGSFTHWISVQRDVTERKAAEEKAARELADQTAIDALELRVFHDGLTGLRNRAYLNDHVQTSLDRIRDGQGERFVVLLLDLDDFRLLNDELGHRVGDLLLIELALRIEDCIRPRDTLGRVGADEFACIVRADKLPNVVAVADRILAALEMPIHLAGSEIVARLSIGVAYVDERYTSAGDVFRDAHTAMRRAKSAGGMRYELFAETIHAQALAALRIQTDLRYAIDRGEFRVYYQPLVNLDACNAYGLEALVRWQHPERGLVSPAEFIPLAEETGLIVGIGTWVLNEACRHMRAWHDAAPENAGLTLSVNVSSRQLYDPRFLFELEGALARSGLDPHTLQLEITESIFLGHALDFEKLLKRVKEFGVRIALDDFGTGYSSLSYLERFRFDTLKIDQSFVARLVTTPETREIVRLIVGIADALKMDVVAEGIEEPAQRQALREYGCKRAQGYLFSRPVPERDVAALLARPLATA